MVEKPQLKDVLKGFFGLKRPNTEASKAELPSSDSDPAPGSMATPGSPAKRAPRPIPQTEAYLNRKKGRKVHNQNHNDLEKLLAAIQSRGDAVPGDLAGELGVARSSLSYNLNKLVAKGCIERIGVGRAIRYRATGKAYTRWGK